MQQIRQCGLCPKDVDGWMIGSILSFMSCVITPLSH